MNDKALEKFKENYQNKGDCKDLQKFKKSFVKKFKDGDKTIEYYPWAVIERIFKMQGGKVEVVDWVSPVEFKSREMLPDEEGEMVLQDTDAQALFIHLKATWMDEEEEEHYPIFDNQNAKVLKTPNAMNLNTSKQRGMVRLIARLSGIGLDIFEKQDTQFDEGGKDDVKIEDKKSDDKKDTSKKKTTTKKQASDKKKTTPKKKTKEEDKKEKQAAMKDLVGEEEETPKEAEVDEAQAPEPKEKPDKNFTKSFLQGEDINEKEKAKEKQEETEKEFKSQEFDKDSQEYADRLLNVRKTIRDKSAQKPAKEFVKGLGKQTLSDLEYEELGQLLEKVKGEEE